MPITKSCPLLTFLFKTISVFQDWIVCVPDYQIAGRHLSRDSSLTFRFFLYQDKQNTSEPFISLKDGSQCQCYPSLVPSRFGTSYMYTEALGPESWDATKGPRKTTMIRRTVTLHHIPVFELLLLHPRLNRKNNRPRGSARIGSQRSRPRPQTAVTGIQGKAAGDRVRVQGQGQGVTMTEPVVNAWKSGGTRGLGGNL